MRLLCQQQNTEVPLGKDLISCIKKRGSACVEGWFLHYVSGKRSKLFTWQICVVAVKMQFNFSWISGFPSPKWYIKCSELKSVI